MLASYTCKPGIAPPIGDVLPEFETEKVCVTFKLHTEGH
jgi:hypothetical protein